MTSCSSEDESTQQVTEFDVSLPLRHTYLGGELTTLASRSGLAVCAQCLKARGKLADFSDNSNSGIKFEALKDSHWLLRIMTVSKSLHE